MTIVYFIRHAESDQTVIDGRVRPLTAKGLTDRRLVTAYLQDKQIDVVLSSPYKRAVDTVADFAEKHGFAIEIVEGFHEQISSSDWDRDTDYYGYGERQWADFSYALTDGESLAEVQSRNIAALEDVLRRYKEKNIVVGTHGKALATMLHYYDSSFGYAEYRSMLDITPWVAVLAFDEGGFAGMETVDLFEMIDMLDETGLA
ncbi:MAG: histidine phosphatase family protein [Clostridiales bacterium]|nr:histidine phosphatase family protein [Clostridiales bacterium]